MTEYTFRRAVRAQIPLLVGLAGGTGAGKTKSMLELLKGMTPDGKRFAVIDTENGRCLHYADQYDFDYIGLHQFRPDDYLGAIQAADKAGYAAIGVDSMSHEWTDGVLGWQEDEFERMGEREATRLLSWKEPKRAHKSLVSGLLQCRAHIVLAFRAEPKVEIRKENGKTVVGAKEGAGGYEGWFPITDSRLHFELTCYLMLLGDAPGKPKPIKLYDALKPIFPESQVITAAAGRQLAEWARGGAPAAAGGRPASEDGASHSHAPEPRGEAGRAPDDMPEGRGPGKAPEWDVNEFSEQLKAATLTVTDLRPLIGPVARDNWQLAVSAWLISNPGKTTSDLIAAAIPPASAPAEQQAFA